MIHVERGPEPAILSTCGARWLEELIDALEDLVAADASMGDPAKVKRYNLSQERYRHAEIKDVLVARFHGKCAYCESRILHVDFGHIEHYRPKSVFQCLTFEWTNLLLSCSICNGSTYKGDRFPESVDGGPLLNPCDDDPSTQLEFVFDEEAKLASVYGVTDRGRKTETILGLNRPDLRHHRSEFVKKLLVIASMAGTNPAAREILTQAVGSASEYAAFARSLLQTNVGVPTADPVVTE